MKMTLEEFTAAILSAARAARRAEYEKRKRLEIDMADYQADIKHKKQKRMHLKQRYYG